MQVSILTLAELFDVNVKTTEILEKYPTDNTLFQKVSIAGRMMSRRIMGASFICGVTGQRGAYSAVVSNATIFVKVKILHFTIMCLRK